MPVHVFQVAASAGLQRARIRQGCKMPNIRILDRQGRKHVFLQAENWLGFICRVLGSVSCSATDVSALVAIVSGQMSGKLPNLLHCQTSPQRKLG